MNFEMMWVILIVLLTMLILLAALPFLNRKTISFGVSIKEQHYNHPDVNIMRKQYLGLHIVYGLMLFLAVVLLYRSLDESKFVFIILFSVFLIPIFSISTYLYYHYKMKRLKRASGWYDQDQGSQVIVVDTSFHQSKKAYSNLWYSVSADAFKHTKWNEIPDHLLVYLFIHDEPTIGKSRSEKTKKAYLTDLFHFLNFIYARQEEPGVRHLHPADVLVYQKWLDDDEGRNYKPLTVRRRSSVIKQFLHYIYKKGAVEIELTSQMKMVSQPKNSLVNRDLYEDEVEQLLNHFKQHNWFAYALFLVLVSTGLRIDELATAQWRKLFHHKKLNRYFLPVVGKRDKEREVVIFEDVLEVIRELRKRRGLEIEVNPADETAFYPKANGEHYNSQYLSDEFTRLVKASELSFVVYREDNITPHTCRHYTASYMLDNGIDIRAIQDLLGHESVTTTERYLWRKRKLENHAGVKYGERFT